MRPSLALTDTPRMANPPRLHVADAAHPSWTMPRPFRRTARAFSEALFSTDEGAPPAERIDWLMIELEDYLAHSGSQAQLVFQASMLALLTLAPISAGKARPLTALSLEHRVEAIERFESTPLGLAVLGAKAMVCLIWYEHPDVQADVGIDSSCMLEESA